MRLRTLGTVALVGPRGAFGIDEPRLTALMAILAVRGPAGVEADELMVLLTPDLTRDQARNELDRLLALARFQTGHEMLIAHPGSRYALLPGALDLDIEVLDVPASDGCADFLAGFALPDSPEFAAWLAEARRRVRPRLTEAGSAPPAVASALAAGRLADSPTLAASPPRWRAVAAVGLVVLAGAFALWMRAERPRGVAGFSAGDLVLLADIANETGDTLFDRGIQYAASVALQQSGHLRLYPRARLAGVYQRMQIANRDTALTFELAQEVAERDQVRFVVGLRLFRDANGYRVTARLADVALGREVADNSEPAERETDVIAALGLVLLNIRERLGESADDLSQRRVPLPEVTTGSLEALRSYAEGATAWSKGNFAVAAELWHRAVDLDTGFAMAYGALGNWAYYHHDRAAGESLYAEALRRANRLTEWERLRLLDGLVSYRGNKDSAIVITRTIATRFPNVVTWYNHGTELLSANRDSAAIDAFRQALTFDSLHVDTYINLATASKGLRDFEGALGYYLKAGAIDSMALYRNNINHEWGSTYVRLDRLDEADSAFRRMLTSASLADRGLGLRSLGYLSLWQGRLGQSVDFFTQAANVAAQSRRGGLTELRNRLLLSAALRAGTRTAEANAEVTRALAGMNEPWVEPPFLAMIALQCVRLGRISDVESVLRLLRTRVNPEREFDRQAEALTAGALQLSTSHPDSALRLFAGTDPWFLEAPRQMMRAEAFMATARPDSARVALEHLLSNPEFGNESQDEWQHAPFMLGELLMSQGDRAGAAKAYRRFLAQWRDAPSALPRLATTRARLAMIGDGGGKR